MQKKAKNTRGKILNEDRSNVMGKAQVMNMELWWIMQEVKAKAGHQGPA